MKGIQIINNKVPLAPIPHVLHHLTIYLRNLPMSIPHSLFQVHRFHCMCVLSCIYLSPSPLSPMPSIHLIHRDDIFTNVLKRDGAMLKHVNTGVLTHKGLQELIVKISGIL